MNSFKLLTVNIYIFGGQVFDSCVSYVYVFNITLT